MSEHEAYKAPEAELVSEEQQLETMPSRWTRLGAAIIDAILIMVLVFGVAFGATSFEFSEEQSLMQALWLAVGGIAAYLLLNGYLLAKNGQTIGKNLVGTKVVRMDGSKVSFGRIVGLRWLVFNVIANIPFIGGVIALIDCLFIFSADKRCLHDKLADTKVVFTD